tara:strand:- start:214 stop:429 length:216 start_codon:yes stop_codon:yes gene_type:complete
MPKKKAKPTGMAHRYELTWTKLFYQKAPFIQEDIINNPHGRYAADLAHETVRLAEKDNNPILITSGEAPTD